MWFFLPEDIFVPPLLLTMFYSSLFRALSAVLMHIPPPSSFLWVTNNHLLRNEIWIGVGVVRELLACGLVSRSRLWRRWIGLRPETSEIGDIFFVWRPKWWRQIRENGGLCSLCAFDGTWDKMWDWRLVGCRVLHGPSSSDYARPTINRARTL